MVLKRKAASTLVKHATEDLAEVQGGKVMKKPAVAASVEEPMDVEEPMEEDEEEEEEEVEKSEEVSKEELENQAAAKRMKELKSTPVNEIKDLVATLDLETGNKQNMIEAILAHEAKARAEVRARQEKIRAVIEKKKEELETQSISDLAKQCTSLGIKGVMSKQARVQCLLKHWQEDDGVDKALVKSAFDARKTELEALEKAPLKSLCEQADIDPFITEVMADRIVKKELEMGCFSRPTLEDDKTEAVERKQDNVDMVTALLDSEKTRKKEKELKIRREEETVNKVKELQALNVQDLRSKLTKKGVEPTGKKDEMVKALFDIQIQEEKLNAKKAELKSMGVQAVKELCGKKGLKTGAMDNMIEELLAHEAKIKEDIRAYEARFAEVLGEKKEELNGKTAGELKELCASKGLKLGINKEERLERLVEDANKDGEVDRLVARAMRKVRKEALLATDKKELVQMCEKIDVDPLFKEVMIERILEHEKEFGPVVAAPPPTKKARLTKK